MVMTVVVVFLDLRKERKCLEEELCSPDFMLPAALQEQADENSDLIASELGHLTSRYQLSCHITTVILLLLLLLLLQYCYYTITAEKQLQFF